VQASSPSLKGVVWFGQLKLLSIIVLQALKRYSPVLQIKRVLDEIRHARGSRYMGKRIIGSTGLSGLIGSRIRDLTQDKYEWVNFSLSTGTDITNPSEVNSVIGAFKGEVILHLAALSDADEAWRQRGDEAGTCFRINVEGTKNIARACKKYQKHLIHVSTGYVFKGDREQPYTEDDRPNPVDWYGQTKLWAEEEVKKSECSFTIMRLEHPFRAYYSRKRDLVRKILDGLHQGALRPQFADAIITPTYVDDIAHAIDRIITTKPGGIFHITGSTALSPFELAHKVAIIFGFEGRNIPRGSLLNYSAGDKRPYPQYLNLSNKKAVKELGIEMKILDEALQNLRKQINQLTQIS
jgi:dTDP-4-dehydrorhamnose reductase